MVPKDRQALKREFLGTVQGLTGPAAAGGSALWRPWKLIPFSGMPRYQRGQSRRR